MKRKLDEGAVRRIYQALVERFGEPIGKTIPDRQGVADERGGHPHKGEKMGNRGFGAKFENASMTCDQCGGMMGMDEETCSQCGMMGGMGGGMDESENGGRHPGHAASCTCPDCSRSHEEQNPPIDEVTPPGREKQVKALKKNKDIDNPWAVAWASYNKKH